MSQSQRAIGTLVFLLVLLAIGYRQTQAPSARADSDLDYGALSRHVATIAARPHPMGSQANRQVRDYIVAYFESLGLDTELQKTTVIHRHPFRTQPRTIIGHVENIIARLPGSGNGLVPEQRNDLVLMAHYDSRPDGPGAGDDASGTASVMETARILASGPKLAHDVIFLITDGEEMGLLGAQGFFRQHSAAGDVGLVLDFEARGSYGTSSMFETSNGNTWLIDELMIAAPDLVAGSLSYEIYRRMPNDTDMSISRGEGIPGLNFAFLSGLYDYHAMSDTPENLDPDTLAQQANYVLSTARHFAGLGQWGSAGVNKTYFNLWIGTLLSYGQTSAVALGVAVLAFGLWIFVSAWRTRRITLASLAGGFLALVVLLVLVGGFFQVLINFQGSADAGIARLISLGEWPLLAYSITVLGFTAWYCDALSRGMTKVEAIVPIAMVALAALITGRPWYETTVLMMGVLPLLLFINRFRSTPDLWSAALVLWWCLTATLVWFIPNAAYVFTWPLASILVGLALHERWKPAGTDLGSFIVQLLAALIPMLLLVPVIILAYLALGSTLPQGIMILSVLVLLLFSPMLRDIGQAAAGRAGLILLAAGLAMTITVLLGRGFDSRHPRGEDIMFAIDVDGKRGYWASTDARPGSWLGDFFGSDAHKGNLQSIIPGYQQEVTIRETPVGEYLKAGLTINQDRILDNGQREIHLRLRSPQGAEYINLLFPKDVEIHSASVNGFAVKVPDDNKSTPGSVEKADALKELDKGGSQQWWRWRWLGLPVEGADLVLVTEAHKALPVRIVEIAYQLPEDAPTRPADSMRKPYTWSDSTVIYQTVVLD